MPGPFAVLLAALALAAGSAGCGSSSGGKRSDASARAKLPGSGRPPVRLATKNFTEQFILGELYSQALTARGFRVVLKQDVGSSEIVDRALTSGTIDMYPEYTGVIAEELAGSRRRSRSAAETYARAQTFEQKRGFMLLARTPGFDSDANVVRPAYARRFGLRSTADLREVGPFTYGGPSENRTRFEGVVGMRQAYGLDKLRYVPLRIEDRYRALDAGRVDVAAGFTTDAQLRDRKRYVLLSDPKRIFGFQNIVPVVSRAMLRKEGPAFRAALDAVSARLTNRALQQMNAVVDLDGQRPAAVARAFLQSHRLP